MISNLHTLLRSFSNWGFWLYLGWSDIRRRYERTVLGPIWSVLNAAFFVLVVGVCYSFLFKADVGKLLPHLAAGYFIWIFITGVILESCTLIYSNGIVLKTSPIQIMDFLLRMITKHFIVFLHNIVLLLFIAYFLNANMSFAPLAIIGMMLLLAFVIPFSLLLSIICCRFRDVEQMVSSLILVLFFVTPVLWKPEMLGSSQRSIIDFNFVFHFIELVRGPILTGLPEIKSYVIAIVATLCTWIVAFVVFSLTRRRLPFWY